MTLIEVACLFDCSCLIVALYEPRENWNIVYSVFFLQGVEKCQFEIIYLKYGICNRHIKTD